MKNASIYIIIFAMIAAVFAGCASNVTTSPTPGTRTIPNTRTVPKTRAVPNTRTRTIPRTMPKTRSIPEAGAEVNRDDPVYNVKPRMVTPHDEAIVDGSVNRGGIYHAGTINDELIGQHGGAVHKP